jgi:DNA-binding winged helix-turn-helix (wHTH) protein
MILERDETDAVEFGAFRFQFRPPTLWTGANRVRLEPHALDVLEVLIKGHPGVVLRADILDAVWGLDASANDENLNAQISAIRKKIGFDAIETVTKVGYRFCLALHWNDSRQALGGISSAHTNQSGPVKTASESVIERQSSSNSISSLGEAAAYRLSQLFKQHNSLCFTEKLLDTRIRSISFRDEWQFLVTRIIEDTRVCLRAMVIDRELARWWNSLAGRLYMSANLALLGSGRTIKRLFIIQSNDTRLAENALLTAYIHAELGIDVRLCYVEEVAHFMPQHADMLSVHDDLMGVLYYLKRDDPTANILVDTGFILDFISFYDEIFADDAISISVRQALLRHQPPRRFFDRASEELAFLHRLSTATSIRRMLSLDNQEA